jgi:hypothetical protein
VRDRKQPRNGSRRVLERPDLDVLLRQDR